MSGFACQTCFDTFEVDEAGTLVPCPECGLDVIEVKLTGLDFGVGMDEQYWTASYATASTLTFRGTRRAIALDVREVTAERKRAAAAVGLKGRNHVSSKAIAIESRVRNALTHPGHLSHNVRQ